MPLFLGLDLSWDCLMESSLNLELYNASTPEIVRLQKTGIYFSSKKHDFVPKYGPPIPFRKLPLCPKIAMTFSGLSGIHLAPVGSPSPSHHRESRTARRCPALRQHGHLSRAPWRWGLWGRYGHFRRWKSWENGDIWQCVKTWYPWWTSK